MSARVTKTEKWKDTFFLNLKPLEKLVFIYIYENCDDSGFFDINFNRMSYEIGIDFNDIGSIMKSIEKAFLLNNDGTKLWLRKFLLHQNKLPLNLKTDDGNFIRLQILNNLNDFNNSAELEIITKDIKKGVRKKEKVAFVKPTFDEVVYKFSTGEFSIVPKSEIQDIYDYYESVGWKVGKYKQMEDWGMAFARCFRRNKYRFPQNQPKTQTRLDNIKEQNEKIQGFDFNTLKTTI